MSRLTTKDPLKDTPTPARRLTRSHSNIGDRFRDPSRDISPDPSPSKRVRVSSGSRVRQKHTKRFDSEQAKPNTSKARLQIVRDNGDDIDDPEVQRIAVIRKILGMDCVNFVNRLKFTWTPPCVQDPEYCRLHRGRKCPRHKRIDHLQSYLEESSNSQQGRCILYLRVVLDMCTRMEFPGEEAFRKILEMVLISKQPEDSPHSTDYILQYCLIVLETMLMKFPPCWSDIQQDYRNIFIHNIDVRLYYHDYSGPDPPNIVVFLLTLLAETIDLNSDDDDASSVTTHHELDQEFENFTQHSREEKLDRLFATLSFLIKVLEYDLATWLLRYPSKKSVVMFSENAPMLAHVLFDGSFHTITASVKKLLEIFVKCTHLCFPQDKIDVLSRLISLLSVGMTCCETQPYEDVIYPNIGKSTVAFAMEIYKTIFDMVGTDIDCFLTVIKNIKIPFVRYLLYDRLIFKFDGPTDTKYMNVRKVHELMSKEKWKCNLGKRKKERKTTNGKYPNTPKKIVRPKVGEIFRHEYMDLIVDCLRSYCETFQVRRVIREIFAKKPICEIPLPVAKTNSKNDTERYRLDKMELDIHELEKELNRKVSCRIKEENSIPFTGILVNNSTFVSYRDDVKYLGQLFCDIKKLILKGEDRVLFESCYLFLNDILDASVN